MQGVNPTPPIPAQLNNSRKQIATYYVSCKTAWVGLAMAMLGMRKFETVSPGLIQILETPLGENVLLIVLGRISSPKYKV